MKRMMALVLCLMLALMAMPVSAQTYDNAFVSLDGTMPILKEGSNIPSMTIAVITNSQCVTDYSDMPVVKYLEEMTGVTFEWMGIPEEGATEKLNLMLASYTDMPDIIWGGISTETVSQYIGQDVFLPTDELIDTYCPNLKAIFEKYPGYATQCVYPDGHTYGFPYIEECAGNATLFPGPFLINTAWLEAVGKEMPTTIDEFYDVLIAFRDAGDLNGNGQADEIPFAVNFTGAGDYLGSFNGFFRLMGCFGDGVDYNGAYPYCKVSDDGEVYMATTGEAFKENLKFFNTLYNEKLLDLDGFTSGDFTPKLALDNAVIGAFCAWDPYNNYVHNKDVFAQYQALPRITGEKGGMGFVLNNTALSNSRFLLTTACEYPEIAAAFVNVLYDPENSIFVNTGALDYQYDYNDEGLLYQIATVEPDRFAAIDVAGNKFTSFNQMRWNTTPGQGPVAVLSEYTGTVIASIDNGLVDSWHKWQIPNGREEVFAEQLDNALPSMMMTSENQETYSLISPIVNDMVKTYLIESVMNGNVDATWDAYITALDEAGLSTMIDILQETYDNCQ